MLSAKEEEALQAVVEDTLGILMDGFDYEKMSLPLIRNTFSLWRNLAFKRISKLPFYAAKQK
jgi:hypothetical protein